MKILHVNCWSPNKVCIYSSVEKFVECNYYKFKISDDIDDTRIFTPTAETIKELFEKTKCIPLFDSYGCITGFIFILSEVEIK